MVRVCAVIVAICLTVSLSSSAFGASASCPPKPSYYQVHVKLPREYPKFYHALRQLWGVRWEEAASVSWQEGSWHYWATNGQYKGTFQCGSWCQSTYGSGATLETQALAAYKYWVASRWSGWECQP